MGTMSAAADAVGDESAKDLPDLPDSSTRIARFRFFTPRLPRFLLGQLFPGLLLPGQPHARPGMHAGSGAP
jgi:hypothetical protein